MSDTAYIKLASAVMQEGKSLVISECSKGGYTIAQKVTVLDNNDKKINLYLKGAIQIKDIDGLINLRDALNIALDKLQKK